MIYYNCRCSFGDSFASTRIYLFAALFSHINNFQMITFYHIQNNPIQAEEQKTKMIQDC